jgi:uncharacterized phage-associated protein
MAYDARIVANEFLRHAWEHGRDLTNMQLQKLVYIAHGYCLALTDDPLLEDSVQAWRYGPVIPILYESLRQYGAGTVTDMINVTPNVEISPTHRALIDVVADAYARFSGPQLSTMTHRAGTPWREVFDPQSSFWNEIIPNEKIKEHYSKLLNERTGINPA